MSDFKDRLEQEYTEVATRLVKLEKFTADVTNSSTMDARDWNDLILQREIMRSYVSILESRMFNLDIKYEEIV